MEGFSVKAFFSFFLILSALVGCSSQKKPSINELLMDEGRENPAFERGMKALENENYSEAAKTFDQLLVEKPASKLDLVIVYNSGAAYEGLGQCDKAAERYREAVRGSAGKFEQIEAQALFRLSLMYECLGQDTKTITSLLDARKRGKSLPYETLHAEIPARLAAAYARIGNRKKALEYFSLASEGLKKMVGRHHDHKRKEVLSRTMYLMGQLSYSQRDATASADSYMQSLSMQQPYLLQATELDHPLWSRKAADDLQMGYENIWKFKLESVDQRRAFYTRGLQVIQELKKLKLPKANPLVENVFTHIAKVESKLQAELAKVAEFNQLTKEAEKREGLKREGRIVDAPEKKPKAKAKR